MMRRRRTVIAAAAALALGACGGQEQPIGATLQAPEAREARVTLTPALDVSGLVDPALSDRLVIDEIVVNVSDVRLLGGNPAIPAGGYPLSEGDRILSTGELERFPFPSSLLDDDLAVYVRIEPSAQLEQASVVVYARLYDHAPRSHAQQLTSDEAPNPDGEPNNGGDQAPNPDGEPNKGGDQAPNPDGEPNRGGDQAPNPDGEPNKGGDQAPNPDGEPNRCGRDLTSCVELRGPGKKGLSDAVSAPPRWIPVELRGQDVADLVVGFDHGSRLDVLLGVPAGRWFTPQVVAELEQALDDLQRSAANRQERAPTKVILDRSGAPALDEPGQSNRMRAGRGEDYRLVDGTKGNPADLRKR